MTRIETLFAPFALRLSAGPLDLRAIRDDDLPALVDLALDGIHDADAMPFSTPWTDATPDVLPVATAAYHWRTRADFAPARWSLELVVRHEGTVVGAQGFHTTDYLTTRTGETGSWLGRRYQGRGIGTAMRQVVCAFLFDHLDAAKITSSVFTDNPSSRAVSRKVGYADGGTSRVVRRPGELAMLQRLVLRPEVFVRGEHPVSVEGADAVRRAIGLPAESGEQAT